MSEAIFIFGFYIVLGGGFLAVVVLSILFIDKRYRKNHGQQIPPGFERTEEVSIDPQSNRKLRVYYNAKTGERFYHEEDGLETK